MGSLPRGPRVGTLDLMPFNLETSLAGVQAHITNFDITAVTTPDRAQVSSWAAAYEAEVVLTVGPTDKMVPATVTALELFCRELVHKATAGRTILAAIPEQAYESSGGLGKSLLDYYDRGLKMLREGLKSGQFAQDIDADDVSGSARGVFPPSLGIATRPL